MGIVLVHLALVDPRLPIGLGTCSLKELLLLILFRLLLFQKEALMQGAMIAFHILFLHSTDVRHFLLVILSMSERSQGR